MTATVGPSVQGLTNDSEGIQVPVHSGPGPPISLTRTLARRLLARAGPSWPRPRSPRLPSRGLAAARTVWCNDSDSLARASTTAGGCRCWPGSESSRPSD